MLLIHLSYFVVISYSPFEEDDNKYGVFNGLGQIIDVAISCY